MLAAMPLWQGDSSEFVGVIDNIGLVIPYYLLMHRDMQHTPRVRAFADFVSLEIKSFRACRTAISPELEISRSNAASLGRTSVAAAADAFPSGILFRRARSPRPSAPGSTKRCEFFPRTLVARRAKLCGQLSGDTRRVRCSKFDARL